MNTAKVVMLGNHLELEYGKEYDLPNERANQLTGIGIARLVTGDAPDVQAAAEEDK